MKYLNKMVLLSILAVFGAQACFVTIVNDSGQVVRLHTAKDASDARLLNPGQETVFGNKTTKADFVVAIQQGGQWKNVLRVHQEKCGMTDAEEAEKKDKSLLLSAIFAGDLGEELNDLFAIEAYSEKALVQEAATPQAPAKKSSCGCKG